LARTCWPRWRAEGPGGDLARDDRVMTRGSRTNDFAKPGCEGITELCCSGGSIHSHPRHAGLFASEAPDREGAARDHERSCCQTSDAPNTSGRSREPVRTIHSTPSTSIRLSRPDGPRLRSSPMMCGAISDHAVSLNTRRCRTPNAASVPRDSLDHILTPRRNPESPQYLNSHAIVLADTCFRHTSCLTFVHRT
jgi:hypothetical protein